MGNRNSTIKIKKKPTFNKIINKSHAKEFEQIETNKEKKSLKYYLPNNNDDIDRQHAHHFIKRYLFQGYFSSPIVFREGFKVLDVGCGAGTWLLDLANMYQNVNFFGLDIAPIFPIQIKPGNLTFIEADMFNGLPFPDNEFDFVHMETMSYILTPDQWVYAISEMIRVTKPSGFMEITESYTSFKGYGPVFQKINEAFYTSCLRRGVDLKFTAHLDDILRSLQSITNVNRDEKTVIVGPNGGKTGIIFMDLYIQFSSADLAVESLCLYLNMSKDRCKDFIVKDLRNELNRTRAAEYYVVRYWAQKIDDN